ncbi:MAG: SGNH/GDSL hydrolase family protein [Myxococcota bacterium]|nr:SGNH/GDSL hydrolase family protein [Myxococcota bacterium]
MPSTLRGIFFLAPLAFSMAACAPKADPDAPPRCETAEVGPGNATAGRLYIDSDGSDASTYSHAFDAEEDQPMAGKWLRLIGADGEQETGTCDDGTYAFSDLDDGTYVVAPDLSDSGTCLQKNCATRFPAAIDEGEVVLLTWGDSVPVIGNPPFFPKRLKKLLGDLASIDSRNVAQGGSVSTDWLPGTNLYENQLLPNIADADVVLVSIGGNDILYAMQNVDITDIEGAIEQGYELIAEIFENVLTTVEALKAENPDIDVVYCLYVDYSIATEGTWGLADMFLPEGTISSLLESARALVGAEDSMLRADMFAASHELEDPLDDYMYDDLHFNDRGQTFYAEEIFKTLGGVLIGESPLAGEPRSPLGTSHDYSFLD